MNLPPLPPPNSGPDKLTAKTPVSIFTGFLGSGKTTVISYVVDRLQNFGQQISYIKNEEGDVDLDAKILGGKHIVAQELLNGCICCTLMGPFMEALDEIIDTYHPDRIIVESSGTAEPGNMAITIGGHQRVFRDGIIEVVDALNFGGYREINEYWKMQTNLTDLILLNKAELADTNQKDLVISRIRDLNNYSPIMETQAGKIEPDMVFGVALKEVDQMLAQKKGEDHQHTNHLSHFVYQSEALFRREKLEEFWQNLPLSVIRIKGWVKLYGGQNEVVNGVFRRVNWFSAPESLRNQPTRLMLFGPDIDKDKDKIVEWLESCRVK